jgi:hypothetical protein
MPWMTPALRLPLQVAALVIEVIAVYVGDVPVIGSVVGFHDHPVHGLDSTFVGANP